MKLYATIIYMVRCKKSHRYANQISGKPMEQALMQIGLMYSNRAVNQLCTLMTVYIIYSQLYKKLA